MSSASPDGGDWYVGTTYEFHDLSDLVAGSSSITDTTGRDRTSGALVVESSRGLSAKWSISALGSLVAHDREVGGRADSTSGVGDTIVIARLTPRTISLYSDSAFAFGFGARVPLGEDDASSQGVVLAEDMQPSTGAFASIVWGHWARAVNDSGSARVYASASYTDNGSNDREYEFGDEAIASFGGSVRTQTPWGFSADLSLRSTERDQRSGTSIPNTGGAWLDLNPAVQYRFTESLALNAGLKIPVARDLHDQLQFTTKYAFRVSVSYVFAARRG